MSNGDRSPPLPLIVAAVVALVLLGGVGVAFLRDGGPPSDAAVQTKPPPTVGQPVAGPSAGSSPAELTLTGKDSGPAAEPYALQMARRLLREEDEAAALDVIEAFVQEEGPDPAALRLSEAVAATCDDLIAQARARLAEFAAAGKRSEGRALVAVLRRRLPGSYSRTLDELASGLGAAPPADLAAARKEFMSRLAACRANPSPESYYELALWARERELSDEATQCFTQTVALDAFHTGARQALGHRKHEGRWYSDDEFKTQVLGLIKDASGRWVKKPEPKPTEPKPDAKVVKKNDVPPPPPAPFEEDKEWYKDPESKVCEWEEAKTYTSKYYEITTNIKPVYAKRYGKMMDQYFSRFVKVFKNFLPPIKYKKSKIFIHSDKKEFHAKNPQVPKTAGGFYQPKTKYVVCYHGLFGKQGTTRTVLAHEGTHQFEDIVLRGKFWNCPIWIIEGLAVFFESAYYKNGDVKIGLVPRERLWSLKRGLAKNALIPLRTLIRTPQRQFGGYHYAHAWSLIYMVIYHGKKKVRARNQKWFSDLFLDALKGKVSPAHVEKQLGGKEAFDELERQWKEWLKELPYDYDPKKHR